MKPDHDGVPILITEAARPYEEQLAARKRKYLTAMLVRFPCLVVAGLVHETWWLAVGILLLSVPLPWIAVLVANDRPPREKEDAHRYQRPAAAVEAPAHPVPIEYPTRRNGEKT